MMLCSSAGMLRRICCFSTAVATSSSPSNFSSLNPTSKKKRLVFMGSPQALDLLHSKLISFSFIIMWAFKM